MSSAGPAPGEVVRLRRCLNDLIGIMALPTLWASGEPEQIANILLDALFSMQPLAFAFVRLDDPDGGPATELVRLTEPLDTMIDTEDAAELVKGAWSASAPNSVPPPQLSIKGVNVQLAFKRLGVAGEIGLVIVGSLQDGFPENTDKLLLDVAANQAAMGLQQLRLLNEQRRVARELDERVAQRTSQLAAAHEELQKSEYYWHMIVDNIPGMVALLSPTGELEIVNRQVYEYFGQTFEELRHWGSNGSVHEEDLPHVVEVFSRSIATGSPYDIEQRFRRHDGAYRWFTNRGFPLWDSDGRVLRWCVLLTDIDERKIAEVALKSREHDLKLIIDTIPALVWCNLPDGPNEFISTSWHVYTGVSPEESHGWGWQASFHPDDLPPLMRKWGEMLVSGEPGEIEARLRRHDGVYRWFLIRAQPFFDDEGKIVRWYGTSTDIEDRKQAEEELRRKEAFLAKAQRLSLSGSFSWCVDTEEVTFSNEAYRIFGFEPGTPVTLARIATRVRPEDRPLLAQKLGAARETGGEQTYGIRLEMPDGSTKYLRASSQDTLDDSGRREYVGAVQDVTARHLAEESLDKARSELAHVSRVNAFSTLTASIAHEINQPLSGIITNASTCLRMLNAEPPNVDGARETARRTIRDGNRVTDVITRLRALFIRKEYTPELLDLNEAIRDVLAMTANDIQRHGVIAQAELNEDVPLVAGDRIQLQQVILNLMRNALDAMAGVTGRPKFLIVRTRTEESGHVRLSVRDAGVGLDGQNMDKIFDSFYTTKSGGMGIGLSVSRSIIERHNGKLWAEQNDGPGATFSFSIPIGTEDAEAASAGTGSIH
ncbi:MAG: PAS domain-containing protein [Paludibaculum sp.]